MTNPLWLPCLASKVKRHVSSFFFIITWVKLMISYLVFSDTSFSQPKTAATRTSKAGDEDDLWGPVAVTAPRTVPHIVNVQPAAPKEDDGLWGSIAVAPPKTTSRPLKTKASAALDDSDPWAAIAAPPPTTKAKPLSLGRGRGTKPASARLGAQRIDRNSSGS